MDADPMAIRRTWYQQADMLKCSNAELVFVSFAEDGPALLAAEPPEQRWDVRKDQCHEGEKQYREREWSREEDRGVALAYLQGTTELRLHQGGRG